jgi:hypothetical protein
LVNEQEKAQRILLLNKIIQKFGIHDAFSECFELLLQDLLNPE